MVIGGMHTAGKIPGMTALLRRMYGVGESPELSSELWGIRFPSPIGLAAGLDKNAAAVAGFSAIGFGFMEVGTVTPEAQPGNEQPRLFRLPADQALINRMGFNNEGADAMAAQLGKLAARPIPLAINIGKNKWTPNETAENDYRACIQKLYANGDFFVVNISSPNTPDLRKLQHGDDLKKLLSAVTDEIAIQSAGSRAKPVLVKIAPDMGDEELEYMIKTIASHAVSGIIATNTTLDRSGLTPHANASEQGGLSGKPLSSRSTAIISKIYQITEGRLPIIGSGGIFTGKDAYEKIRAGASMVEIYTALIYEGPELLRTINRELSQLLKKDGYHHISQAVGADAQLG